MKGEKNLTALVKNMKPQLNSGRYVFLNTPSHQDFGNDSILFQFKEEEGITVVMTQEAADALGYSYDFVASWITLRVHSSLEAVGLTALFSKALAENDISCNVVAGYYHDHIFVDQKDAEKSMVALQELSASYQ